MTPRARASAGSALRIGALAVIAAAAFGMGGVAAASADTGRSGDGDGHRIVTRELAARQLCTPTDPDLEEVSGLVVTGEVMYAIGDSGSDHQILVLGPGCAVVDVLEVPVPTVDVEDMALGPDGRLWLADIGDNRAIRQSVRLIGIDPADPDEAIVHELVYPDRAHDAEALLLGPDGMPIIVVKKPFGPAGVYAPEDPMTVGDQPRSAPIPLAQVGTLELPVTDTPGGPIPGVHTSAITGGAVDPDGTVAALRTYTDLYLYRVAGGEIVAGLEGPALHLPLPERPQGEAIALAADGAAVMASEAASGPLPPLDEISGAVQAAQTELPPPAAAEAGARSGDAAEPADESTEPSTGALLAIGLGFSAIAVATWAAALWKLRRDRRD